jgi:hypothetical protein
MLWDGIVFSFQHLIVEGFDVERFHGERKVAGQHGVHVHTTETEQIR